MNKYLFPDFLKEKIVYQTCRLFWQVKIEDFLEKNKITNAKPYLNTTFSNGYDFFNGNPIVNYYIENLGKAIRIIQEEPNRDAIKLSAWIDDFETDNMEAKELVISIQLTPDSENLTFDFISKWVVDNYSAEKMEKYIDLKMKMKNLEESNPIEDHLIT
ncbi:MAG: hypothetical protein JEY97_15420 [Bacteroidales bacterium]|nr:hypothetical protein [Bacteroidales bacterium]